MPRVITALTIVFLLALSRGGPGAEEGGARGRARRRAARETPLVPRRSRSLGGGASAGPPRSFCCSALRVASVAGAKPRDCSNEAAPLHSPLCARRCTSFATAFPSEPLPSVPWARFPARFSASLAAVWAKSPHRPARAMAMRARTLSRRAAPRCAGGVLAGSPPVGAQRIPRNRKRAPAPQHPPHVAQSIKTPLVTST